MDSMNPLKLCTIYCVPMQFSGIYSITSYKSDSQKKFMTILFPQIKNDFSGGREVGGGGGGSVMSTLGKEVLAYKLVTFGLVTCYQGRKIYLVL